MKSKMSKAGYDQGDMSPKVDSLQKPESCYAERGFGRTLDYIERQDKIQEKEASSIRKQSYKGRYS